MEIKPIAYFRSPFKSKFGLPRQSGVVPGLRGKIVFVPEYRNPAALRGLEDFSHLWLIWEFSANRICADDGARPAVSVDKKSVAENWQATVRPPRLGGNARVGVFASRSPFRPNGLGLSCVKAEAVDFENVEIEVLGADLMDGTPIYDIKPYVPYADSYPDAEAGFVAQSPWKVLEVFIPEEIKEKLEKLLGPGQTEVLTEVLAQDPRPQYQNDSRKVYGMEYGGVDVRFRVEDSRLIVIEIKN